VKDSTKSDSDGFTITGPAISVTITNKVTTALTNNGTITFNATVRNDTANKGITWTLTEIDGTTCPIGCGQISNATATSVTYTPPTRPFGGVFDKPIVVATSVSDPTKFDQDNLTLIATTVTIIDKVKTVQASASAAAITFHAVVQNDPTSSAVIWSLSQVGVPQDCSPACGSLSNATATSVVYTPPASVPSQPANTPSISAGIPLRNGIPYGDGDRFDIISGTVISCAGTPTGKESLLNGQYAIFAQGPFETFVMGASFAADGTGKISDLGGGVGGSFDLNNGISAPESLTLVPSGSGGSGSFYRLGPDPSGAGNLGCFQMATSDGATSIFRFAVGSVSNVIATSGHIIEYDDQSGTGAGVQVSGVLRLQDPTSFSTGDTTQLHTNYAFGVEGTQGNAHMAGAGTLTLNPATGAITFTASDGNFLSASLSGLASHISSVSAKTGRGDYSIQGGSTVGAVYIVNANEFFLVNLDQVFCVQSCSPLVLYGGRAIVTGSSFSSASLSGNFIFHLNGNVLCAFGAPPSDCRGHAALGVITMTPQSNSGGTSSGSLFTYNLHAGSGNLSFAGDQFAVDAAKGRVTLGSGTTLPVLYLTTPAANTEDVVAFAVGADPSALFGLVEPGAAQAVTTASLAGSYLFGSEDQGDFFVTSRLGVVNINTAGTVTGTELDSSNTGLQMQAVNRMLTIDNVAGPGAGNVGANTFAVTNGRKLFFIDTTNAPRATITVVEPQ
jgi:hypothetical protein